MAAESPKFWKVSDAADALGVSANFIRRALRLGQVHMVQHSAGHGIPDGELAELRAWITTTRVESDRLAASLQAKTATPGHFLESISNTGRSGR